MFVSYTIILMMVYDTEKYLLQPQPGIVLTLRHMCHNVGVL